MKTKATLNQVLMLLKPKKDRVQIILHVEFKWPVFEKDLPTASDGK